MNKVEQSEIIKNQAKNIEREVRWGNVDDILDENLSPSLYCLVHNYIIDLHKEIEQLQKQAELGEHYKHLYSEVKKRNNNAIKFLKSIEMDKTDKYIPLRDYKEFGILLRMLGEIDNE